MHVTKNPFPWYPDALEVFEDGGLLVKKGLIQAIGPYTDLRRSHPLVPVVTLRGGLVLPGLVDTHVHFPQARVIGRMGLGLLEWLEYHILPEEARLSDTFLAAEVAKIFVTSLLRNGTTTAMVFGAHQVGAQESLFRAAKAFNLRIISGLDLGDRNLRPDLHTTPKRAYRESLALARSWHRQGKSRYALTPRFALSTSEALLEACAAVIKAMPGLYVQTHLNETAAEIQAVRRLLPWADDYLAVYERFGLVSTSSVFAHNLHVEERELAALAAHGAAVAHCPSSNAFLGSGIFPMQRHLHAGVRFALGSDVAAGTGYSLFKEGLAAYQMQMLRKDGIALSGAHLLYLATLAGAEVLTLEDEVGSFAPGKAADFIHLLPKVGSTLDIQLAYADSANSVLGAVFALADEHDIYGVYQAGEPARFAERPDAC